ncbi:Hypothetical protein D9617_13g100660 [Elsinoe fawcettii]|nr:Hypothetical protein D9617_13g100660 [Elsinoe fawcettii]
MQSDLHNGLRRKVLPPRLQIITTAHTTHPESLQSPATPIELRRRSTVAPSSPVKSDRAMSAIEEKQAEQLTSKLPLPPPYPGAELSFYNRFFCRPRNTDPEKLNDPSNYRFSFRSRGFILAAIMLLLALTVIIAPVVGSWHHRNRTSGSRADGLTLGGGQEGSAGRGPGSYSNPSGTAARGSIGSVGAAFDLGPNTTVSMGVFSNFADPYILQYQGLWYAYATNNAIGDRFTPRNATPWMYDLNNVQMAVSSDFYNWNLTAHATEPLPNVGAWSDNRRHKHNPMIPKAGVWAPAVFQRPSDKKWVMYYSARPAAGPGMHCIGASVSSGTSPAGPFIPEPAVFTCHESQGGAIDPAPYLETNADGTTSIYIVYKVDGNNKGNGGQCGNTVKPLASTPIMVQKVKDDGVTPDGAAVQILDRSSDYGDGPLVEAPSLVKVNGMYFLFFSSGCTANDNYNVKYAWSTSINGPYTRAARPLLRTGMYNLLAPGSCGVTQSADGSWRIAFHARVYTAYGGLRSMFTSGLQFNGTSVNLYNPDRYNGTIVRAMGLAATDPSRLVQFAPDAVQGPTKRGRRGKHHGKGKGSDDDDDDDDSDNGSGDDKGGDDDSDDNGTGDDDDSDGRDDSGDAVTSLPATAPTARPNKTRTTLLPRATTATPRPGKNRPDEGRPQKGGKGGKGKGTKGKGTKGKGKGKGRGSKGRNKSLEIDGRDS